MFPSRSLLVRAYGLNQISIRMMNIEQRISSYEVSSRESSLLDSIFDIRHSAVLFCTSSQIAEKLHTNGLKWCQCIRVQGGPSTHLIHKGPETRLIFQVEDFQRRF
jgi:hypothetical protein